MRSMCRRCEDRLMFMNHEFVRKVMPLVRVPDEIYHDLFQEMGRCLWCIQFFEDALATYLVAVFRIPKKIASQNAWTMLEETRRSTAGTLLKELRKEAKISSKTDKLLAHIVSERNWLAHRLQHENGGDLYFARKFDRLLQRIHDLGDNAIAAQYEFGRLLIQWTKKHGATDAEIDQETLRRLSASRRQRRRR